MKPLAPGSLGWMLAHEMRLAWRAFQPADMKKGRGRRIAAWIVLGLMMAGALAGGIALAVAASHKPIKAGAILLASLDAGVVFIASLMLSQALVAATTAFYERGDLDLLLSSPMKPTRVFAVRTLAIAVNASLLIVLLVTPFVVPLAFVGYPNWLGAYVAIASLSLLMTSAGVGLAMALFATLGARRTRTVAQVMAAFIGAGVFLFSQGMNIGSKSGRPAWAGLADLVRDLAGKGWFDQGSPLAWPALAAMGSPLPMLGLLFLSMAVFSLTIASLGRRFAANATVASSLGAVTPGTKTGKSTRFGGGVFRTLVVKELRLIARDPSLISQVLLQTIYMVPLSFMIFQNLFKGGSAAQWAMVGGAIPLCILSGQLASGLGWIVISGEEAPDLMTVAPVEKRRVELAKLSAACTPPAVLVGGILLFLLALAPVPTLVTMVGCGVSIWASANLELKFQRPAKRSQFRMRGQGSVWVALGNLFMNIGIGLVTALVAALGVWAAGGFKAPWA